jgi:hypothetical protein
VIVHILAIKNHYFIDVPTSWAFRLWELIHLPHLVNLLIGLPYQNTRPKGWLIIPSMSTSLYLRSWTIICLPCLINWTGWNLWVDDCSNLSQQLDRYHQDGAIDLDVRVSTWIQGCCLQVRVIMSMLGVSWWGQVHRPHGAVSTFKARPSTLHKGINLIGPVLARCLNVEGVGFEAGPLFWGRYCYSQGGVAMLETALLCLRQCCCAWDGGGVLEMGMSSQG